jgi:hypothetical protein
MRLKRLRKRWRLSDNTDASNDLDDRQLLAETRNMRRDLLATTENLSAYTRSLNAEIKRLKKLADRVGDNGQRGNTATP